MPLETLTIEEINERRVIITERMKVLNQYNNGWCKHEEYYSLKDELLALDQESIRRKESIDNE